MSRSSRCIERSMGFLAAGCLCLAAHAAAGVRAGGMKAVDSGGPPAKRTITVLSPGVYKAVVSHRTAGGISEIYDLAHDPRAEHNLAFADRGLLEIGWHGGHYKARGTAEPAYDGCADWPSARHSELEATGELEIVERSAARVRIRAQADFTWWGKLVHKGFTVTCIYTFYPAGRIVSQVTVANRGAKPFHWSREYGPHLMIHSTKTDKPGGEPMGFGTPAHPQWKGAAKAEELVMAYPTSEAVKAGLIITIPPAQEKLFTRHMRHGPAGHLGWDRAGYGSEGIVMDKGYRSTWACMIQLGTAGSPLLPQFRRPADGLGAALDYRRPARIAAAETVADDAGDLDRDGFNESEGCYVLRGAGPVSFTFAPAKGSAGLAPVFKIKGWKGPAPRSATVNGRSMPAAAAVVDGGLVIQLLGSLGAEKAKLEIPRGGSR